MRLAKFFLFISIALPINHVMAETEQEKMLAVQKVTLAGNELGMIGMGLTQLMSDDYYIGAFYIDETANVISAEDLADYNADRRMVYRFASDRKISARGFSRKIAQSIRINSSAANVKEESVALKRLLSLFKGSYKKGDVICIDYLRGSNKVQVRLNNRLLGEVERARELYQLIVKTWVGERPPSSQFKNGISGNNEGTYAVSLLKRYVNL